MKYAALLLAAALAGCADPQQAINAQLHEEHMAQIAANRVSREAYRESLQRDHERAIAWAAHERALEEERRERAAQLNFAAASRPQVVVVQPQPTVVQPRTYTCFRSRMGDAASLVSCQ